MYEKLIAALAARTPSAVKYKLVWSRRLYVRLLRLRRRVITVETPAGSFRWTINEMVSQEYIRGTYEPYMQAAFMSTVGPGSIVFDIGAHAGFHSIFCGLLVQRGGHVVGFEPNPKNRASMQEQVDQNRDLPISLLPYALSDHEGIGYLDVSKGGSQGRIADEGTEAVELRTIDSLVCEGLVAAPNVVKVDVEGHETEVLRGATRTLSVHRPIVLCDPNDETTAAAVSAVLAPLGYRVTAGFPILGLPL